MGGRVAMTKLELIARLAQRYPQLVAKDAEYAVKMILDGGAFLQRGKQLLALFRRFELDERGG